MFESAITLQSVLTYTVGLLVVGLLTVRLFWRRNLQYPPEISRWFSLCFGVSAVKDGIQRTIMKYSNEIDKDMCTINLGIRKIVLLNTHEAMREAYQKTGDAITGRDKIHVRMTKGYGVARSEGHLWKEQRRFTMSTLRDFGMGKIALEEKILDEALVVTSKLEKLGGKPVDIWRTLGIAISNVICSVVFCKSYDQNDPICDLFLNVFNENGTENTALNFLNATFPFLRHLPGDLLNVHARAERVKKVDAIILESIQKHKENVDPSNVQDFIDAYLIEMNNQSEKEATTFTDPQLVRLVADLFAGGSETTATTLRWAIKYMILHPDIQSKVQHEIDDVIGSDRLVRMSDRPSLQYTERVLMETQRLANLVIVTGHRCIEDVQVGKYFFPKDAMLVANLYKMHTNSDIWPNPSKFDPDNFVDNKGKTIRREHLVPFALGKRSCIGESMAKMELFIFFVTFLQKFTFKVPDGQIPPGIDDSTVGIFRAPKQYELCAISRH